MPDPLAAHLGSRTLKQPRGITLVETLVGIAVFAVVALSLFAAYARLIQLTKSNRLVVAATAVAKQQMELIRNLTYINVGVVGSVPAGVLPQTKTVVGDNTSFTVRFTVRNIDDPFDGTINGSPHDLSPADYKQATVEVSCPTCNNPGTLASITTEVVPKNLETASTNGALFVQVIDANGQPVAQANVHIENTTLAPPVTIDDVTDNNGLLEIIDVPPALESYRIVVTKSGYSTDRTYSPTDPVVINPLKQDATVLLQQVTQVTFAIDKVSTINVSSITTTCVAKPSMDFTLTGAKLISQAPDVHKYSQALSTNTSGLLTLNNMEWDSYTPAETDPAYDLTGTIPLMPLNLAPNNTQDLKFVVQTASPHSLLVIVRDAATQLPLSGASVHLYKPGSDSTLLASRGYLRQTTWNGGSGQANFTDETKYFSDDGNIGNSSPPGEVRLRESSGKYVTSGQLTSSTFDAGTLTNFTTLEWQPGDQPSQTGSSPVMFQIATNNDNTTWNFKGPDGTASSYYTTSGQTISTVHNGTRYLRYKLLLATAKAKYTPNISDIAVTFVSSCIPPGQAFFNGLSSATYNLDISLTGYQTLSTTVNMSPSWNSTDVSLLPQ